MVGNSNRDSELSSEKFDALQTESIYRTTSLPGGSRSADVARNATQTPHTPDAAMKSAMLLLLALIVAPEVAMATNAAGLAFLAENKGKEGVVELPCVCTESSLRPLLIPSGMLC